MTRLFHFCAGLSGPWHTTAHTNVVGAALQPATRISVMDDGGAWPASTLWTLSGITSNERYVTREERSALVQRQQGLGRSAASCAALIPIRKSAPWWALTQDERRDIVETQSHHIAVGMRYLPAIARRLHHCRDLSADAPFDFLTWFEFAPGDTPAFDALLDTLRASPEWAYVEREVDIRLERHL